MIKKIKTIAISSLLVLFGFANAQAIDSYAVGISGSWGAYEADGSETVASSKQKDSGETEITLGSIFAEVNLGMLVVGLDYIPFEADSESVTNVRADTVSTGTNTASVTISDHVTAYILAPLGDSGVFLKVGYSEMELETKENLATGGKYPDKTVNGYHYGVGYEADVDSNMFVRGSVNYHEYDDVKMTNQNNSAVTVEGELDGYSAEISIGRRF